MPSAEILKNINPIMAEMKLKTTESLVSQLKSKDCDVDANEGQLLTTCFEYLLYSGTKLNNSPFSSEILSLSPNPKTAVLGAINQMNMIIAQMIIEEYNLDLESILPNNFIWKSNASMVPMLKTYIEPFVSTTYDSGTWTLIRHILERASAIDMFVRDSWSMKAAIDRQSDVVNFLNQHYYPVQETIPLVHRKD